MPSSWEIRLRSLTTSSASTKQEQAAPHSSRTGLNDRLTNSSFALVSFKPSAVRAPMRRPFLGDLCTPRRAMHSRIGDHLHPASFPELVDVICLSCFFFVASRAWCSSQHRQMPHSGWWATEVVARRVLQTQHFIASRFGQRKLQWPQPLSRRTASCLRTGRRGSAGMPDRIGAPCARRPRMAAHCNAPRSAGAAHPFGRKLNDTHSLNEVVLSPLSTTDNAEYSIKIVILPWLRD